MNFLGIDNGVSGTIACLGDTNFFVKTPVRKDLNYTKEKAYVNRVDFEALFDVVTDSVDYCLIERPMINPQRFKASVSAIRAMEATLLFLEAKKIRYEFIDSRAWQGALLPKGVKGAPELKEASKIIGARLFPQHAPLIEKHGDADGLLIAEYCRRKYKC